MQEEVECDRVILGTTLGHMVAPQEWDSRSPSQLLLIGKQVVGG